MKLLNARSISRILLAVVVAVTTASCGGGGGGGSGGGSRRSAETGVRILHGAIEASPVEVYSTLIPDAAVQTAFFGENTLYGSLPGGEQTLTLTRKLSPATVFFTADVIVEKNQHRTILFYGDESSLGLRANIFSDDPGDIPDGLSAVRLIHAVVGAASVTGSVGSSSFGGAVSFGETSGYVYLPPGSGSFGVTRVADGKIISRGTLTLEAGRAYSILVAGETDFLVVNRLYED